MTVDFLVELDDLSPEEVPLFLEEIHLFVGYVGPRVHF